MSSGALRRGGRLGQRLVSTCFDQFCRSDRLSVEFGGQEREDGRGQILTETRY